MGTSGCRSHRPSLLHVIAWLGVFGFWLLVTRNYHPTFTIATTLLVASFACAVYINGCFLWPRFARLRLWWRYLLSLLATVAILNVVVVLLIQVVHDVLWGPDPARFGFWTNFFYDSILITVHLAVATGIIRLARVLEAKTPRPSNG